MEGQSMYNQNVSYGSGGGEQRKGIDQTSPYYNGPPQMSPYTPPYASAQPQQPYVQYQQSSEYPQYPYASSPYPPQPPMYLTGQTGGAPQPQPPSKVVVNLPTNMSPPVPPARSYCGHMVLACLVFWCCGWVCGFIAFILAFVANNRSSSGRYEEACQLAKASLWVSIAGIVVGCIIIAVVLATTHNKVTVLSTCMHRTSGYYTPNEQCYCMSYLNGPRSNMLCSKCC